MLDGNSERANVVSTLRAAGRAACVAEGSIVAPRGQIETEARERAEAALADEMQDLFDLIPCPACGGRSENAGPYRQNTVLAMIGCVFAGAAMGVYAYLMKSPHGTGPDSPLAGLVVSISIGIVLAGVSWHRRNARISRVASAVRFLPAEEEAPAPRRRPARKGASTQRKGP